MKKYSEEMGQLVFDWNEFLSRTTYTDEELESAYELSNGWTTCACGQQCDIIPRGYDGRPVDEDLKDLGNSFNCAIENMLEECKKADTDTIDFEYWKCKAIDYLHAIEERSALLIAQIQQSTQ